MKLKFLFLFLFLISIFAIDVFGLTTSIIANQIYLNETFNYSDAYSNHGWTEDLGFGSLQTVPYTVGSFQGFGDSFSNAGDSGIIYQIIPFRFNEIRDHNVTMMVEFSYNNTESNMVGFGFSDNVYNVPNPDYFIGVQNVVAIRAGAGVLCATPVIEPNVFHTVKWIWNPNGVTDLYIDGELLCTDTSAIADRDWSYFSLMGNKLGTLGQPAFIDYVLVANVTAEETAQECVFPTLFCDDFDYSGSLIDIKDWTVYNYDNGLGSGFVPQNSQCRFNGSNPKSMVHGIDRFPVFYPVTEDITTTYSIFAPRFTEEFQVLLETQEQDLRLKSSDYEFDTCHDMRFYSNGTTDIGIQFQWFNTSLGDWVDIVYLNNNTNYTLKIVSEFTHLGKTSLYNFNTSQTFNNIDVYLDGGLIIPSYPFANNCDGIYYPSLTRENNWTDFVIDDYYLYVGTDKSVSTLEIDTIELFDPPENATESGVTSTDLFEATENIWDTMGLQSAASKLMVALIALFIVTVAIVGLMVTAGHFSLGALVVIDMFLIILFVFIGLMPIWILFLLFLIGGGIGALAIKTHAQ